MESGNNAAEIFDKYASQYEEKYMQVDLYKDSLNVFIENLNGNNAHILDLGCGPGNMMKYISDKNPVYKIMGTDLSPNMLKIAEKNNPSARFRLLDIRKTGEIEETFDGIICSFGIPYLNKTEVHQLIKDCYERLQLKGMFYLSTMEGPHSISGNLNSSSQKETLFTWYYEADFLKDTLENIGFKVIHLQRLINPNERNDKVNDLIIIAEKSR